VAVIVAVRVPTHEKGLKVPSTWQTVWPLKIPLLYDPTEKPLLQVTFTLVPVTPWMASEEDRLELATE